ncbi:MAG TPA: flagellar protein FlgN [Nitrospira sp.]|nr:flagellar protein FlgN [Nitrospira sp.]
MLSRLHSAAALELSQLIDQEDASCRALLETVETERHAIRVLAITDFYAINARRLMTLETMQTLAQARDSLVSRLARHCGLPPSATLQEVIGALPEDDSRMLRERYDRVVAGLRNAREQIKQNEVLIENIRGFLERALSAATTAVPGLGGYDGSGRNKAASAHAMLVRQQG